MTDRTDPTDNQIAKYSAMNHHLLAVRAAMQLLKIQNLNDKILRLAKRNEELEITIDRMNALERY